MSLQHQLLRKRCQNGALGWGGWGAQGAGPPGAWGTPLLQVIRAPDPLVSSRGVATHRLPVAPGLSQHPVLSNEDVIKCPFPCLHLFHLLSIYCMLIRSRGARRTRLLPWAVGCPHHARCTPPPSSSSPGVRGSKHSARSPPESLVDEGVGLCRVVRVVCMGDRETSAGTDAPLLAYFVEPPPACLDPKDSAGAREQGVRWEKAHRGSGWWGSLSPPVLLQALGGIQPHSGPGSPADPASEDTPPLASGLGRCRNPGFSKDSLEDKGSGSVDTGEPCLPPLLHPQLQNLEATGQWGKTTGPGSVRPSTRLPRAVLGLVTLRSRGGQRLGLTRAFWQPSPCPPPL